MFTVYWGVFAGILLIVELIVPALISIWFAIAAFIVMFISIFTNSLNIQIITFLLLSIVLLFCTKKIVKTFIRPSKEAYTSEMIGETVIVSKILSHNQYEVKFKGVIWYAISDEILNIGDEVKITGYKGNKIIVEKEV